MSAKFGPAGNANAFYEAGYKSTYQAPAWLKTLGLSAYEYQCGRGVRLTDKTAEQIRREAEENGIAVSLHAPYFISLASKDPEKRDNSIRYILDSADAVVRLGGDRIVVHPGGLGGLSREDATALACETLTRAQQALDAVGLSQVHICPETMGKINQLGTLEEVLTMCGVDERFLPCVDFGHLNSRTHGEVNSREAFDALLTQIEEAIGQERASHMHVHFSKIEYTAGGEKRHLTFEDTQYGPEPDALMQLFAKRGWSPVVICESDGTQAHDAAAMNDLYHRAKEGETV
ncbi:MAG: TIM barrel protein [Clostridia bacterium]|nr:TIM barrel protein [Clostridia bacterium]